MDLIDEDPHQPRNANNPGFSAASLAEMAASIRLRKVKTPISVRDNPQAPGRFIINHGARRFRASRLAGNVTIPAFIDNDYNEADQVVENLQRNELTAREIADYIGRELAKGRKKGEIAIAISKSPAFVTQHAALLDLPGPLAAAFSSGRASDVTMINEPATIYRKKPRDVAAWLDNEGQEITRGAVKLLRAFLDDKLRQELPDAGFGSGFDMEIGQRQNGSGLRHGGEGLADQARIKRPVVQVRHDGRAARMMLHRRPAYQGWAWLKYLDDGQESEVDLAEVILDALLEE
jgi:ParB family transcriptional regulator, chromosome partitioning protein